MKAVIRNNRLPMSAPASVPAAVAESQNVSLTAWSGVTRSNGKYIENIFLLAKVRDSGGLSVRQAPVTMAGWEFLRMEVEHTGLGFRSSLCNLQGLLISSLYSHLNN
ncbi:uncharacterized protein [Physcomitrium patens]|uniref:uncharacterized protein isoform X2 n=1 Tax=Physcomitrium patens TaxID=3218 RepID=UPI003CCCAF3A